MTMARPEQIRRIEVDPVPKGKMKHLGGANRDEWNHRLVNLVARALPVNPDDIEASNHAAAAVFSGMIDMKPTDPTEGILISQLIVAHEAALSMYQRAWSLPPQYFEAKTRYLQLADKAMRTVAMLTERLDQHRGRGQQQITVKHVTVNADQAVVADTINTGKQSQNSPARPDGKLLTTGKQKAMEILDGDLVREGAITKDEH